MGDSKCRLDVLHNFFPVEDIAPSKSSLHNDGKLHLLSVGRLVKEKNYDLALQTAAELKARGIAFVWDIIGDGPEREKLDAQAAALGLKNCVHFIGAKRGWRNDYPVNTVYVQTSNSEGWGLAPEEASLCGMRVVCTDLPVFHEVSDWIGGTFAFAITAQEFADKIGELRRNQITGCAESVLAGYKRDREKFLKHLSGFLYDNGAVLSEFEELING